MVAGGASAAGDPVQAGGHRRGEDQEANRRRERQMHPCLTHGLVDPTAGAVDGHVGLVLRAVGQPHARHPIAGRQQIDDLRAANDFRAVTALRGGQHGVRVDHRIEPAFFRKIRDWRVANDRVSTPERKCIGGPE